MSLIAQALKKDAPAAAGLSSVDNRWWYGSSWHTNG